MAKPTVAESRWDTDGTNMAAPSAGQRDTGIVSGAAAISSYINYLLNRAYLWAQYVDAGLFEGAFGLTSVISPAAITGANADYAPTGHATTSEIRQDLSAAASLSGIAGGVAGRLIVLRNLHATHDLQLVHDATSTAANRFSLPDAKDLYLVGANSYAILKYDGTLSRWVVIATNGRQAKDLWLHGASFQTGSPATDVVVMDGAGYVNTSGGAVVARAPLHLAQGTRITAVAFRMETGAVNGTHSGRLDYADPTDPSNSVQIGGSASTATESSDETFTIGSGLPHVMLGFAYTLGITFQNGDSLISVKISYY